MRDRDTRQAGLGGVWGGEGTVGEGREREKLPRCLKMVHAPAPAPMTLYIPSPLPPIRPLCSTLHLPISLKLA